MKMANSSRPLPSCTDLMRSLGREAGAPLRKARCVDRLPRFEQHTNRVRMFFEELVRMVARSRGVRSEEPPTSALNAN
jgi:hypothetical protein